jgi:hypothetical protein
MIQENLKRSRNLLDMRQLDKTQYLELTSYNTIIFVYEWRKERSGKRCSRRNDTRRYGIKMISFNKYFFKNINLI